MCGGIRAAALLAILAIGGPGCAGISQVRYVYQDGSAGVIGMPENSSRWPTYYRKHAEELMKQHFPEGFEIVRAEEVVEGSRTLTIKGANSAEIDPAVPSRIVSVGKLGRSTSRSQSDSLKIKECRIVYKRSDAAAAKRGDYAEQASWNPAPYIDPNTIERRVASTKDAAGKPGAPPQPTHLRAQSPPPDGPDAGDKVAERVPFVP
jgi:hypothetical protein